MNTSHNAWSMKFLLCSYGYGLYGRTSSNNMSDSSVSDTHSARTVSQQTSPSHGTHSSSQSRQDNSATIFTALFDYVAQGEDELSLQRGETVEVRFIFIQVHTTLYNCYFVKLSETLTLIIVFLCNRFYLKTRKSQATRDGGLAKFTGKWESFRRILSQRRKVSIRCRRWSIKFSLLKSTLRSCNWKKL